MSESQTPWYVASASIIIATLSGALSYIFKLRENENTKRIDELKLLVTTIEQKSDKCEDERFHLFAKCEVLQTKVDMLEKKLESIDVDGTQYSRKHENLR